jgi:integrase
MIEENSYSKSLAQSPENLTQNFFILLPGSGPISELSNVTHAENVLHAIRAALGVGGRQQARPAAPQVTLDKVAREWLRNNMSTWAPSYRGRLENRLETYLLEHLGSHPISEISPPQVLEVIRKIEMKDARETARRILRIASAVFRYGIATGQCVQDPTTALKGALRPAKAVKHRAMLTAKDLPKFLHALSHYQGDLTKYAMQLVLLTFVRTSELRFARWHEFEGLEGATPIWRIPAERMKMGRAHLVPLARQAVDILKQIRALKLGSEYLFPANTKSGVISENTVLFALYRMGYRRRATVHGFRSLASTVLNEAQFNRDWIEMQLAHADNSVRGVYNAAEWLSGRREMLQWWADFLETKQRERAQSANVSTVGR